MLRKTIGIVVVLMLLPGLLVTGATPPTDDDVLIRGAPLAGSSNGLAIDSQGHLAVANVWAGTISMMDVQTGKILHVYGPEYGGLFQPDDVAFGPDGALYFTQEGPIGGVARIAPDGKLSTIASLPFANPLRFSADGRLFVAQCFGPEPQGLYEVDPQGVNKPRLIVGGLPGCAVNAMDFGPDGYLYGPKFITGEVVKIDTTNGQMTTVLTGFSTPAAVEFDSKGRMHVADQATGKITRVDLKTGNRETLATLDIGLDNLVFDAQDRLYVSSGIDGFIIEVLPDGTTRIVSKGGMVAPAGITVQGNTLFVAEPQAIREFDRRTGEQTGIERAVFGASDLGSPFTVVADGNILVLSSWLDNSVRVWDRVARKALGVFSDFGTPVNALRFRGDLIVAELGTTSIVRANGKNPAQRDTLMKLTVPAGLAATDKDLWASDWATGMVWQLAADGEILKVPRLVGQGFKFPEGLAVTPSGMLVIVETGTGNLVSLDPKTGQTSLIAEKLAVDSPPPPELPVPPTLWFNGVTVAEDGTVYAGGRAGNVIYQFKAQEASNVPKP